MASNWYKVRQPDFDVSKTTDEALINEYEWFLLSQKHGAKNVAKAVVAELKDLTFVNGEKHE